MKKEMTIKEKRFNFFADPQEEKYFSPAHCTHLQIAQTNSQSEICKRVQLLSRLETFYIKGIHGIEHAYRVLLLIKELAKLENLTNQQTKLLIFCAIFHDIGRKNDEVDCFHGQRSITFLKNKFFFGFTQFDNHLTKFIIDNHCINDELAIQKVDEYNIVNFEEAIYLLNVFKDADNLDRVRLGDFNQKYLRANNSFLLIDKAKQNFETNFTYSDINKMFNEVIS